MSVTGKLPCFKSTDTSYHRSSLSVEKKEDKFCFRAWDAVVGEGPLDYGVITLLGGTLAYSTRGDSFAWVMRGHDGKITSDGKQPVPTDGFVQVLLGALG